MAKEGKHGVMDGDEDALRRYGDTGGDVSPHPNPVFGEISTESDGDVGSREGVEEPHRGGVFESHKGEPAETGVINPQGHFVIL